MTTTKLDRSGDDAAVWGVPMVIGILFVLGGTFAFIAYGVTSLLSVFFIAGLLLGVGVLELVAAIRLRHAGPGPFVLYLLAGVLALVTGALFLYRPGASLASLTLLIAAYLFASGLFRGVTSIVERYPLWGWDLAYGIVAVVLGWYVVASWPASSVWVLGTIVSAEIVARGIALVAASWALRELVHGDVRRGDYAHV